MRNWASKRQGVELEGPGGPNYILYDSMVDGHTLIFHDREATSTEAFYHTFMQQNRLIVTLCVHCRRHMGEKQPLETTTFQ